MGLKNERHFNYEKYSRLFPSRIIYFALHNLLTIYVAFDERTIIIISIYIIYLFQEISFTKK